MTSSKIQEIEERLSDYDAATVTLMQGIEGFREYTAAREQLYFNRLHSHHNPAFNIVPRYDRLSLVFQILKGRQVT